MLFYGKQIDFAYIILVVILILAVYILYSFYQQQKESIPVLTSSKPIIQPTLTMVAIPNNITLANGAFAFSFWVKLNSSPPSSPSSSITPIPVNLMRLINLNTASTTNLSLTLDNNGNLDVSYLLNSSNQTTTIMLFPVAEPVNIVLNYNGDDDVNIDKSETVYDPTTNKNISIYNTDSNTFYNGSKRALDVYINGLLNNTVIIDTLTNSTSNANSPYVTYMDASMNYVTTNGNQLVIGDNQTSLALDGIISNAAFIKNGCSPQDVRNIFNQGNTASILDNILSYKLRFGLIEDNKEVKMYDVL